MANVDAECMIDGKSKDNTGTARARVCSHSRSFTQWLARFNICHCIIAIWFDLRSYSAVRSHFCIEFVGKWLLWWRKFIIYNPITWTKFILFLFACFTAPIEQKFNYHNAYFVGLRFALLLRNTNIPFHQNTIFCEYPCCFHYTYITKLLYMLLEDARGQRKFAA